MNEELERKLREKIRADTKDFYNKPTADNIQETKAVDSVEFEKQPKDFVKVGNWWIKYEK